MAPLIAQEIYLLERYSSAAYLGQLRDTWGAMLDHLERCLDDYMRDLDPHYRSKPLPEQPDVVWGERVLPNFRATHAALCDGYLQVVQGDVAGLAACSGVLGDFKGQTDFWSGWMARDDEDRYGELLNQAVTMAGNMQATVAAYWHPRDLTVEYEEDARGALDAPVTWPVYRLHATTKVSSGAAVQVSGVYLPDLDTGCAQFLSTDQDEAPEAITLLRAAAQAIQEEKEEDEYDQPEYGTASCLWTLVGRVADSGGAASATPPALVPSHRVLAGEACPASGFYYTPAHIASRRQFRQGEIMPSYDASGYGITIWQWDADQD